MNIKSNKGSITIFVLVGLLFMTGFLIISFGSNVNKSKVAKEQFNIMSGIYSHNDGDAKAYDRAYTALRKKKAQTLTSKVENSNTLNLTKTFSNTKISDYKIYGNSVQDTTTYGTPSPTNPVEIQSVGDLITDKEDVNYGKYKIPVKVSGKNIFNPNSDTRFTLQEDGSYLSNTNITTTTIIGNLKGTYTISLKVKCPIEKNYRITAYYTDGTYTDSWKQSTGEYIDISLTTNGKDIEKIIWNYGASSNQVQFKDFQIERGTTATNYEQYVETKTFNIYLDEPLRKIGEYADYINFGTRRVIRQINKINLKDYTWVSNDKTPAIYYIQGVEPIPISSNASHSVSNILVGNSISGSNDYKGIQAYNSGIIRVRPDLTVYDTVEKWQEYIENNESYLLYAIADLPKTIELPELKTFEDYTNIEVLTEVAPSKIEATYYGYTMD